MNPTEPRYPRNPVQPAISTQTPSRPNPQGPMQQQGPSAPRTPTYAPNNQRLSQPARPIERPSRPQPYPPQVAPPLPPTVKLRRTPSAIRQLGVAIICFLILVTAAGVVVEGFIITTGATPLGR